MTAPQNVSPQKQGEYARKNVEQTFAQSNIADLSEDYPKFAVNELTLGKVLGKGGFGTVSEVRAFKVTGLKTAKMNGGSSSFHSDPELAPDEMESRAFIAEHCLRNGGDARYAVKILSPEVVADPGMNIQGMVDMATETRCLSSIHHPNIIKMRAIAKITPYENGYFIVMDRLYDTLEARLKKWESKMGRSKGFAAKLTDRNGEKAKALLEERLVGAFDLAAAVEYLHTQNIIYRDIKPENIGFDIRDDIKLFDFGLAKELLPSLDNGDGTYKLTGMTGSPRYMAPEVANEQPYNSSCDVYSFAVLLWQMMSCKIPYEMYTPKSLRAKVYNGDHKRPLIDATWSKAIQLCLKRSWGKDIHSRNTMAQVTKILRAECVRVRDGNDDGLEHNRRRSTFVFRGNERTKRTGAAATPRRATAPPEMARSAKKTPAPPPSEPLTTTLEC